MVAAAEYYYRASMNAILKAGYERYGDWYQGKGYGAEKNYAASFDQLYDSGELAAKSALDAVALLTKGGVEYGVKSLEQAVSAAAIGAKDAAGEAAGYRQLADELAAPWM